jgi:uncharacterized protein
MIKVEIIKGIEAIDLALFIKESKTLIITDLHIGYEEALNKQGVLIPRFTFKETIERLGWILLQTQPRTVVIAGDLKHEFGAISEQEWRDTLRLIDFIGKTARKIVLVKGNHDTILGPIANKRNVTVTSSFKAKLGKEKICIIHGDKIPENNAFRKADIIIIGHEHPAISISDGIRSEKYKCFIKGTWKKKILLVLPSFNLVTEGTNILNDNLLSPFLEGNLNNFEVYIAGNEPLHFGKLKNLRQD